MWILAIPLMVLNLLGGLVSGIWLALLQEWSIIGMGIIIILFGHHIIIFVLMLGMTLFGFSSIVLENKGNKAGSLFFFILFVMYLMALITVWCIAILVLFNRMVPKGIVKIPALFWSYGTATDPWVYVWYKDQSNNLLGTSLVFAEIAFFVVILMIFLKDPPFGELAIIFALIMAFAGFVRVAIVALKIYQKEKR